MAFSTHPEFKTFRPVPKIENGDGRGMVAVFGRSSAGAIRAAWLFVNKPFSCRFFCHGRDFAWPVGAGNRLNLSILMNGR
jgi:hypothetical protein